MAALEGLFKKTLSLQFTPVFTDYCGHYRLHRLSLFTTVITVYMLSLYFTVGFTPMSTHMDCMGSQEDIFSGCMVVRSAHGLSCSASFRGSNENLKGMPVKRNTVRAADFTRQANASDKFLSNVMTLPSFSNIEKMQFEKLQTLVSNMSCNEEQSAKVAEVVGKLKHFQKKTCRSTLGASGQAMLGGDSRQTGQTYQRAFWRGPRLWKSSSLPHQKSVEGAASTRPLQQMPCFVQPRFSPWFAEPA